MKRLWVVCLAVAVSVSVAGVFAQGPPGGGGPGGGGPGGGGPGGQGGPGGPPPPPPLVAALDANHDGVIDAQEIDNAPAALRTLDKNKDGKLTPDEFRPPHPGGRRGPEDGERRPQGGDEGNRPPNR
jgi:hypothetical protein